MFEVWIWMVIAAVFVVFFVVLSTNGKGRGFRDPTSKVQYDTERDQVRDKPARDNKPYA